MGLAVVERHLALAKATKSINVLLDGLQLDWFGFISLSTYSHLVCSIQRTLTTGKSITVQLEYSWTDLDLLVSVHRYK